jgi:hypothetical protein
MGLWVDGSWMEPVWLKWYKGFLEWCYGQKCVCTDLGSC